MKNILNIFYNIVPQFFNAIHFYMIYPLLGLLKTEMKSV